MPGMTFKQLEQEVLALRDELAKMRRLYEDLFYNLDDDNFSSRLVLEKNNMKTEISAAAGEIKTKVSRSELDGELEKYSTITQTADKIGMAVTEINDTLNNYSTIEQTAHSITTAVNAEREFVTGNYFNKADTQSQITQSANSILSEVSSTYETKSSAEENYSSFASQIEQTEQAIQTKVSASFLEPVITGAQPDSTGNFDKTKMYYYADKYYFWNGTKWAEATDKNIYSAFLQTADGFYFQGDVETNTNNGVKMKMDGSYFKIYQPGYENAPKAQIGFFDLVSGGQTLAIPQIILGVGNGASSAVPGAFRDQLLIQKFDGSAYLRYIDGNDIVHSLRFDENGVDFTEANGISGISGNIAVFG